MVQLPGLKDRLVTAGSTGSGKTVGNTWQLSKKNLKLETWIYFDYKNDDEDIINQLPGVRHIDYDHVPKKPGLYAIHPLPSDDELVDAYLWRVREHRNIGLYFDECLQVPSGKESAVRAILTQGRSLYIPVIASMQRVVHVDRFFFSESQYIQIFELFDLREWEIVSSFIPIPSIDWILRNVKDHRSLYYEVKKRKLSLFSPVPSKQEIFEVLDSQLRTRKI